MIERTTQFSECRRHRFVLWREWGGLTPWGVESKPVGTFVQFIGLNPSKANEADNDMTISKCVGFASRWGYRAICMTNLFTFVSTDPQALIWLSVEARRHDLNLITEVAQEADLVVVAWGNDGARFDQSFDVVMALRRVGAEVFCLGKTSAGNPRHPSRIGYSARLEAF
jgi:hypothetical protein